MIRCKHHPVFLLLLFLLMVTPLAAQDETIPLPELESIRADNAPQIQQLARFGNGVLAGTLAWSPDGQTLAVGGSLGIRFYSVEGDYLSTPSWFDLDANIAQVSYSPDGRLLAYVGGNDTHLLDAASKKELAVFENNSRFAFHPDSTLIATSGWEEQTTETTDEMWPATPTIYLWNLHSFERVAQILLKDAHYGLSIESLAFSPDGSRLAGSWINEDFDTCANNSHYGQTWDVSSALNLKLLSEAEYDVTDGGEIIMHPDGSQMAVWVSSDFPAALHGIRFIDLKTGEVQAVVDVAPNDSLESAWTAVFSPDGKTLTVVVGGDTIQQYDVNTQEKKTEWQLKDGQLVQLAYSPNGRLLAGIGGGQLFLWEMNEGNFNGGIQDGQAYFAGENLLRSDGAALLTRDYDNTLHFWSITDAAAVEIPIPETFTPARYPEQQWQGNFTPHPTILVFERDDQAGFSLWNFQTGEVFPFPTDFLPPHDVYHNVVFSPDGRWLALVQTDNRVHIWPVGKPFEPQNESTVLQPYFAFSTDLIFSPDNQGLLTIAKSGVSGKGDLSQVEFWDAKTGERLLDLGQFRGRADVEFSQDGRRIAMTNTYEQFKGDSWDDDYAEARLINLSNGEVTFFYQDSATELDTVLGEFPPDFTWYLAEFNAESSTHIEIIGTATGEKQPVAIHSSFGGGIIGFSPDSDQTVLSASDVWRCGGEYRTFSLYNIATGENVTTIGLPSAAGGAGPGDFGFSPDGAFLAVADGYSVELYDTQTGEEIADIMEAKHDRVIFNAAGTMLITTGNDGTVRLWGIPASTQ
ncbi:MAG TPA: WD40 repeat domain-containing protein [Phototrophicaceae bacterium]|nr:WD40 repeat domain-containing protein [Phototrophicaceae bacterium]